jgi:hypothetical protein
MVSVSACHAEDPGSIPGGGVLFRVGNMGGMRLQCLLWLLHVMTCGASGNRFASWIFEMLIRCFTFGGKLTDQFNWQRFIDN